MNDGDFAEMVSRQNMRERVEMAKQLALGLELMVDGLAARTHCDDELLPCRECITHGFSQLKTVIISLDVTP